MANANRTQTGSIVLVTFKGKIECYEVQSGLEIFLGYLDPSKRPQDVLVRAALINHESRPLPDGRPVGITGRVSP